jgi:hypothetical protein
VEQNFGCQQMRKSGGGGEEGDLNSCYLGNFSFATNRTKDYYFSSSFQNVTMVTNICIDNVTMTFSFI